MQIQSTKLHQVCKIIYINNKIHVLLIGGEGKTGSFFANIGDS